MLFCIDVLVCGCGGLHVGSPRAPIAAEVTFWHVNRASSILRAGPGKKEIVSVTAGHFVQPPDVPLGVADLRGLDAQRRPACFPTS